MRFPVRSVLAPVALWVACLGTLAALRAQQDDAEPSALSARRVAVLKRLTQECLAKAPADADPGELARDILGRFAIAEPGCPTGVIATPIVGRDVVAANTRRIVDALVAKRFVPPDREKLKAEAAAKYPIVKKGDYLQFYYATNPEIARRASGVYEGRSDDMVKVGPKFVRVEDIARVRTNAGLLLQLDPEASMKLREEYVESKLVAQETAKVDYERQAMQLTTAKQQQAANQANETEGYLWVDGKWTTAASLVGALVAAERERLANIARQQAAQQLAEKRDAIAAAADSQAQHEACLAAAVYTDVDAQLAAYKQRVAATQAGSPTEVVESTEPTETTSSVEETTAAVEETAPSSAPRTPVAETPALKKVPMWAYGVAGAILLVAIAGVVMMFKRRAAGPSQDLKKFFQGRGKVQRTFWQMAEEKPDTFKYVAYRYPTAQDARQALLQLSYINERVGGDLVCRHDVYFGYGPHQDKFVSFVGGETLHYALWREASAVFPEYPAAEYFRVSTAPDVRLEIPNLESLLADPELQIEHVENREGEGTDYSQYYVYRAPQKENALEFLKHAHIQEAGLHVVVLTTGGVFGKDENGIYEEPTELWAERYPELF